MSRYSESHVKKNYFTKSQTALASPHPKEEFMSIIKIKKQFQSLIKQQLDALEMIDNAEAKELSEWENQLMNKQTKMQEFKIKESQYEMFSQKTKEEKMSEEIRACFDQLKLNRMRTYFRTVSAHLRQKRRKEMRKRAGKYLHQETLCKKYFKEWVASTYPDAGIIEELKQKIHIFQYSRKKLFLNAIKNSHQVKQKTNTLSLSLIDSKKSIFLHSLAGLASKKYTQAIADQQIGKILKRRGIEKCNFFFLQSKSSQSINQKQRLLENIYCHRRLNSFFNTYRQIKFKRQHSKITGSIINKIDLHQLIEKTEENSIEHHAIQTEVQGESRKKIRVNSQRMNTALLHLILENFIDQYSQQYECPLNQSEFDDFLFSLKFQCLERLILSRSKKNVFQALYLNKRVLLLCSYLKSNKQHETLEQLKTFSQLKTKERLFSAFRINKGIKCFLVEATAKKELQIKINQLTTSKLLNKFLKKQALMSLTLMFAEASKRKFKKEVAENWRKVQLGRKTFRSWKSFSESQSDVVPYDTKVTHDKQQAKIVDDYYDVPSNPRFEAREGTNQLQMSKSKSSKDFNYQRQSDEYETHGRVSRAKQQLSKIVNIIGRGLNRSSMYNSSKKSSDSQSSNRPTLTRIKTQSDNRQPIWQEDQKINEKDSFQKRQDQLKLFLKKNKQTYFMNIIKNVNFQGKLQKVLIGFRKEKEIGDCRRLFSEMKNSRRVFESMEITRKTHVMGCCERFMMKLKMFGEVLESRDQLDRKIVKLRSDRESKMTYLQKYFFFSLKHRTQSSLKKNKLQKWRWLHLSKQVLEQLRYNFEEICNREEDVIDDGSSYKNNISDEEQPEQIQNVHPFEGQNNIESNLLSKLEGSSVKDQEQYLQNHSKIEQTEELMQQQEQQKYNQSQQYPEKSVELGQIRQQLLNYLDLNHSYERSSPQKQGSVEQEGEIISKEEIEQGDDLEGEAWLTETIKIKAVQNVLKTSKYLRFFASFLTNQGTEEEECHDGQQQEESYIENNSSFIDCEDQLVEQKHCLLLNRIKLRFIDKLISNHEKIEQREIVEAERADIIRFSLANREKSMKKKIFEVFYSQLQGRWSSKIKRMCFTGWKLFSGQKTMLRKYLEMEGETRNTEVSYYPRTVQEKETFQQIRNQQ